MIGNVIGVKPVKFTNKETGEVIEGTRLYVIADDMDCFGKSCEQIWVGVGTPLEKKLLNISTIPKNFLVWTLISASKATQRRLRSLKSSKKPQRKQVKPCLWKIMTAILTTSTGLKSV